MAANLLQRVAPHREGATDGFTRQYGCKLLVYYQVHADVLEAIAREKQIKAGSRRKKLELIEGMNPLWSDLYSTII